MPTGYTSKLVEKGQSFQEFVLGCARAFGACVTMRDDPSDSPIPNEFKPSDYHLKEIKKAEKALKKLLGMEQNDRIRFAERRRGEQLKSFEEYLLKREAEHKRLQDMNLKVKAWIPPTSEHSGLKDFMLQQISVSDNGSDYYIKEIENIKSKTVESFYTEALETAKRDVKYHEKEHAEEVERVAKRNDWVKKLRDSLKP